MKKKIILVDDHAVVRSGLKMLIERLGEYEVVQQFDNGKTLTDAYPYQSIPDLIIMDINMPIMNGYEAFQRLKEMNSDIPVLILTLDTEEHLIVKFFRAGVRGYLAKDCTAQTMKEALEAIFNTGYYHNDFLLYSLQNETPRKKLSDQEKIMEQLSEREKEFLRLVCHEDEYTYDQISGIMGVQHRTVDGYRESIFEKFAIKSKTGLVLFVLKHNLFDLL